MKRQHQEYKEIKKLATYVYELTKKKKKNWNLFNRMWCLLQLCWELISKREIFLKIVLRLKFFLTGKDNLLMIRGLRFFFYLCTLLNMYVDWWQGNTVMDYCSDYQIHKGRKSYYRLMENWHQYTSLWTVNDCKLLWNTV